MSPPTCAANIEIRRRAGQPDAGHPWVALVRTNTLTRIDPETGEVRAWHLEAVTMGFGTDANSIGRIITRRVVS